MGFFDTLRSTLRGLDRETAELRYINQATSRVDLEMREREIDRGRFRQLSPRRR